MRPFQYGRAESERTATRDFMEALGTPGGSPKIDVAYLAGGATLLDLMKLDVMRPTRLIDINDLDRTHGSIRLTSEGLEFGALVRMEDAATDPVVKRNYPMITDSLRLAASRQLRGRATLGGNVLQRTRCAYFRDHSWPGCNKRNPGSGCAALTGVNRTHAILGGSEACIATYPGDFAQALIALDAKITLAGVSEQRTIPFADLHRVPGTAPHVEVSLRPGELITSFRIPALPWARRSLYVKVRDRQSYEFALASAAVALDLYGTLVRDARVAMGGVATIPWRAREAEHTLIGKPLDEESARRAADIALAGAVPRSGNAFKIELGKATLARALLEAAALEIDR